MNKFDPQLLQTKYEDLLALHQQLKEAQQTWLTAQSLVDELSTYYQHEQWLSDHEADLDLDCKQGAYSILSEDGLWNTLHEHHELALRWMRLGLEALEK